MSCILLVGCSGCNQTLAPSGAYSGDAVQYHADNSIVTGKKLLDDFVEWEQHNRTLLWQADPGIKKAADNVRANAKAWVKSTIALNEAYRLSPTPEKKDALQTSLNILDAAISQSLVYFTKYGPGSSKPK